MVNDAVLSADSHDSGINVEVQYSRPMRPGDAPLSKPLPSGWERHEGMCAVEEVKKKNEIIHDFFQL